MKQKEGEKHKSGREKDLCISFRSKKQSTQPESLSTSPTADAQRPPLSAFHYVPLSHRTSLLCTLFCPTERQEEQERERERETDRQTDRDTERDRDREKQRQTDPRLMCTIPYNTPHNCCNSHRVLSHTKKTNITKYNAPTATGPETVKTYSTKHNTPTATGP